jgi:nucleoside-triphosphatase THEP1
MTNLLLTGEVHTGKSSEFKKHFTQSNSFGLINPVDAEGHKQFHIISKNLSFPMNAQPNETAIEVGKYRFSTLAFDKANQMLIEEWDRANGKFIFDEVGKLELDEKGLFPAIQHILNHPNPNVETVIWVIRDYLLEAASAKFGWSAATVIYKEDLSLLA